MKASTAVHVLPEGVALKPFQKKAVRELQDFIKKSLTHSAYNACEQGLGKTPMSVALANALHAKSVLIIAPASVLLNWIEEFQKWSTGNFNYFPFLKTPDLRHFKRMFHNCVVISYDLAKKKNVLKTLSSFKWDLLILDEAHKLKGRSTLRTQAILGPIWKSATYRLALSGTPITDSVIDAFPLFARMLPTEFPNFYQFANKYAQIERSPWGDKYYGIKNADELKKTIRKNFFVRYTKTEVMPELPPKVFTKITLPDTYKLKVPENEEEILEAEFRALEVKIKLGYDVPAVPVSVAGIRREQAVMKLPPVIEFVTNLLEQEIPVVVFTYHTQVLFTLEEAFGDFHPAIIHGATDTAQRNKEVRRFQEGHTNLFIGQMVAAGIGTTLTRSSTVVFAEMDWSPANVAQSIDRCHRIGTKDTVNIYYFVVKGSIEESIIQTVAEKADVFATLMDR